MNRLVMVAIPLALVVGFAGAAAFTLAQTHTDPGSQPVSLYRGGTPPPGIELPEFTLRNQRGDRVSSSALRGKVVVFTFLDSVCKDSCPLIAGTIGAAISRLRPAERALVSAFALTVNPATDTPHNVTQFLRARRADRRLDFLLGTTTQLQPLWKQFGVIPATETGDADIHSADVRIFDRTGIWRATQHPGVDLTPANLTHDIREALR